MKLTRGEHEKLKRARSRLETANKEIGVALFGTDAATSINETVKAAIDELEEIIMSADTPAPRKRGD